MSASRLYGFFLKLDRGSDSNVPETLKTTWSSEEEVLEEVLEALKAGGDSMLCVRALSYPALTQLDYTLPELYWENSRRN